ncbi:uncharacterized protein LOC119163156 isoform X2 [Rhipicephalus microplus]|uniref:uncharacterized protein LOC119163156 isoform X2 n=1 Tax=Rhipicephalus microplus TaxID=6941 RepID=UPI003F6D1793
MHKELLKAIFILSIVKETQHIPVCCIPARRLLTYSMKQFVDTSELIWAVKTTKPGNIKCQYDEKRLISENYIIYNTTFFQGRQRYSIRLRGDFDPEAPNRMLVSTLDAGAPSLLSLVLTFWFSVPSRVLYMVPFSVETLLYETHNNSCGVVKMEILTGERATQYDLRVRDASVRFRLLRSCSRRFHRVAGHGRCIYSSECRHLKKVGK